MLTWGDRVKKIETVLRYKNVLRIKICQDMWISIQIIQFFLKICLPFWIPVCLSYLDFGTIPVHPGHFQTPLNPPWLSRSSQILSYSLGPFQTLPDSPRLLWTLLEPTGLYRTFLDNPRSSQTPLDPSGLSRTHWTLFDRFWTSQTQLATPGPSWTSWILLDAHGYSWTPWDPPRPKQDLHWNIPVLIGPSLILPDSPRQSWILPDTLEPTIPSWTI